jgi:hypothetical protein
MSHEKKWVYWHRVVKSYDEELKVGQLLGLKRKTPTCARIVDRNGSLNFEMYAELKFLGRLLRTATAEEVVANFGKGSP